MSRELDAQSKAMWDELRNAPPLPSPLINGEEMCCRISRAAMALGNNTIVWIHLSVPLKHCPGCGRKLR